MGLLEQAKTLDTVLKEHRAYLHKNAETGFDLPLTRAYVKEKLIGMGYDPVEMGGGIVALAGGQKPGKTFLIRADMDALPMKENTDIPCKSKTGNMHACGHDFHTAMLLGAAQLLKNNEQEINGTVKLMFQPAEEILSGAKAMIDEGLLENPKVDAAAMIHIMSGVPVKTGTVLLPAAGIISTAADWFDITITGVGSHGAMPENSVDPINVASYIHTALQTILAREISPGARASVTIGCINGGKTGNVIPDTVTMTGTIRTIDENVRTFIKTRIVEISENIARAFRAAAAVNYYNSCPCGVGDEAVVGEVIKSVTALVGEENTLDYSKLMANTIGGSEDFSYIGQVIPSASIYISAGAPEDGYKFPAHHPEVVFDEDCLTTGAAVYANTAMEWLKL